MTRQRSIRDFSNLIALLIIGLVFALLDSKFVGARNLSLLMTELSITAILALGMLIVILPGHIDLSVGSGVGLLGGIAAVLITQHSLPAPLAMLISIAIGILLWLLMGSLIVREKLPAFIVTLGGLLIFKGLFWFVIQNATIPVVPGGSSNLLSLLTTYYLPAPVGWSLAATIWLLFAAFSWTQRSSGQDRESLLLKIFLTGQLLALFVLITNQYRGIPLPAVLLGGVALIVHLLIRHSVFGRHLFALGGNEEAARLSGLPLQKIVVTAFAIMGAITALAGLMQTAYVGSATTTVGELMELDAIAACVIGGVSLRGGRGSVSGVLFGALIMATLLNGMTLLSVSPEIKLMVRGSVLVLAVWVDLRFGKKI
jgi:D-xylose transport system permease protein